MKKWLVYVLGVISGIFFTFALAFCVTMYKGTSIIGLELFDEPEEFGGYSQFEVFQIVDNGCALAHADDVTGPIVYIIPEESQKFYDDQEIVLGPGQCAVRVGTYKYSSNVKERTVPAIQIVDGEALPEPKESAPKVAESNSGKTLFDKPGECVSRNNFEIQKVLESGDAIAKEVSMEYSGHVITTDLEVLMLAHDGKSFYDNQIVRVPKGKCARQVGTYKYKQYSDTKVIPIVEIR